MSEWLWLKARQAVRGMIFDLVLAPLIRRNYRKRAKGLLPDEWYWADELALSWGFAVVTQET